MKFGENLYNLRKNAKISQEKLAEKIGVSRQSVSKWETGVAYPEMNRILKLCEIFHCKLNDLVNDNILDFDSLDEDVKMSVVKFNKEKQRKLKTMSKIIFICSKVLQITTVIVSIVLFISMFFTPTLVNNVKEVEGNTITFDGNLQGFELGLDGLPTNILTNLFEEHSKAEITLYAEIIIICLIISMLIISFAMLYLSKLFKNINKEDTPFTLDNLKNIKITSILFIIYLVFTYLTGIILECIIKRDLNISFGLDKILCILIIICIYYVFDYGHQIQLDSKGKIYGDK